MAATRAEYEEKGYVFIRGFFTEEEIRSFEEEVRSARVKAPSILDKDGLLFRQYLHVKSPSIQGFLSQKKVVDLIKTFAGDDFWLRKDQGVFKKPGGIEFPWHQDNGYNGVMDAYHQFWVPLTPMNPENGGLFIIPRSHRWGVQPHAYHEAHYAWSGDDSEAIPILAERGDVLVFSSLLLHRTGPNKTPRERIAYVAEFMSSEHYDPEAKAPFFQVAKGGRPDPRFVRSYKGHASFQNRLKYVVPLTRRNFSVWKGRLGKIIRKWSQTTS